MTKVSLLDLRWRVQKFEIRHKRVGKVGLMKWFVYGTVCILRVRTVGKQPCHEIIVPRPLLT